MALDFIFMLTRNDRTVADPLQYLQTARDAGVHHIGFKNLGLNGAQLIALNQAIKTLGATSYLEVVSLDRASEMASAQAAVKAGVDCFLGGVHVDAVLPILADTDIRYFPFPGRVTGHPSVLEGSMTDIVASAEKLAAQDGVHGLDLLAYRSSLPAPELVQAVCGRIDKPVIVAGSITAPQQITAIAKAGAAGFTIGSAVLEGRFPATSTDVACQLNAIMTTVNGMAE